MQEAVSLQDPIELNRFITATEALLSWIESCKDADAKNPNICKLEAAWNTIFVSSPLGPDKCQQTGKKPTQAVARCTPSKNRNQDAIPYDVNRVVLRQGKEDYVNASHVELGSQLGPWCPRYIVAQAPLPSTVNDYWNMILEQECEVVVFLANHSQSENEKTSIPAHWPELNKPGAQMLLINSPLEIRVQAIKGDRDKEMSSNWIERILTIRNRNTQQTRTVVHLQYLSPWPFLADNSGNSICETLTQFIVELHSFYRQQRNLSRPILVTCECGQHKSGVLVAASIGILHIEKLGRLPDLVQLASKVSQQRRGLFDKAASYLLLCRVVAQYSIDLLSKRDIVVGPRRLSTNRKTSVTQESALLMQTKEKSSDILLSGNLQDLMAALKIDVPSKDNKTLHETQPAPVSEPKLENKVRLNEN
ncbi:Tyrosine-protein phosphatase non-receptor type 23 [Cichlidogyrus casuarinus]|uniref:Tyrosine-protein phosphatase non-receptor type 23 n=1 Tax=Cichlidogyrus casuarinus TaxID=1844966 RepID=A0ABD2PU95_9PLAT